VNPDHRPHDPLADPPRFLRCRRALAVRCGPGTGAALSPYRRCPPGVIATVDCPEYAGRHCGFHEDRGADAAALASPEEVAALGAELARDFLTVAYARRLEALRAGRAGPSRGADLLLPSAAAPVEDPAPPVRRPALVAPGPVNVPADPRSPAAPRSAT
jgi:hypothetical protein